MLFIWIFYGSCIVYEKIFILLLVSLPFLGFLFGIYKLPHILLDLILIYIVHHSNQYRKSFVLYKCVLWQFAITIYANFLFLFILYPTLVLHWFFHSILRLIHLELFNMLRKVIWTKLFLFYPLTTRVPKSKMELNVYFTSSLFIR